MKYSLTLSKKSLIVSFTVFSMTFDSMKYAVTNSILWTREERISAHETVERTKGLTSQSKATGKMGSEMKEKLSSNKCILEELTPGLNRKDIKVSPWMLVCYPLECGINLPWAMEDYSLFLSPSFF